MYCLLKLNMKLIFTNLLSDESKLKGKCNILFITGRRKKSANCQKGEEI